MRRPALRAGANFAQEFPGIKSKVVVVIPFEADGVFAHAFGGHWLGGGLEHGKSARREFGRIAGFALGFIAFFVAHGAGARVAQKHEVVVGDVAVGPFDIHTRAGSYVYLDRLGIRGRAGSLKRGLHEFSIA